MSHTNRMKRKKHMIAPIDVEKAFDKIQHLFMIKNTQYTRVKWNYLTIVKVIYDKLSVNITVNGERLKAFPIRQGTRQE